MGTQAPGPAAGPDRQLRARSPLRFFLLVFALSTPLWLLGALTRRQLTPDLPVSSFIWVCPVVAASLLVAREEGAAGVARLLRRAVDWRRIRDKGWLAAVLLLPPGIYALTYALLWLGDRPLPAVRFPLLAAAGQLVAYLVAAEWRSWAGPATPSARSRSAGTPSRPGSSWGPSGPGSTWCRWSSTAARPAGSPGGR